MYAKLLPFFLVLQLLFPLNAQNIDKAIILISHYRFSEAEQILTQHLESNSNDLNALRWLSVVYLNNQNFSRAIDILKRCQQIAPTDPSITINLARALKRAGQLAEAEKQLMKVYNIPEFKQSAGILLANLYFDQNRFNKSLTLYQELIQSQPQNSYFYKQAGRCALKLNQPKNAEQFLQKALQLNNKDIEIYVLLFNLFKKKEQWEIALQTVQQGLLHHPKNATLLLAAGDCQFALKKYSPAIKQYHLALTNGDSSAYLYKKLGAAYYYTNNYASALLALKKSIRKDAKDAISHYFLGLVQKSLNLEQKAIVSFQRAINLSLPGFLPDVYFHLADAFQRVKNYPQAIAYYKKVMEIDTTRIMPIFYMATIYDKVYKDRQTPLKFYQKFLNKADESIPQRFKSYALERMKTIREQLHFQKGRQKQERK